MRHASRRRGRRGLSNVPIPSPPNARREDPTAAAGRPPHRQTCHQNVITPASQRVPRRPTSFHVLAAQSPSCLSLRTPENPLNRPLKAEITGLKPVGGTTFSQLRPGWSPCAATGPLKNENRLLPVDAGFHWCREPVGQTDARASRHLDCRHEHERQILRPRGPRAAPKLSQNQRPSASLDAQGKCSHPDRGLVRIGSVDQHPGQLRHFGYLADRLAHGGRVRDQRHQLRCAPRVWLVLGARRGGTIALHGRA